METDRTDKTSPSPSGDAEIKQAKVGRRHLLRGAASAAPVLMTLNSRPVLAVTCVTASASTSLNPSGIARATSKAYTCSGLSPSQWNAAAPTQWPGGADQRNARFNAIFDPDLSDNPKLIDLIGLVGPVSVTRLAQACTATLLNVQAGRVPLAFFGGFGSVQAVWAAANATGGFSPSAGVFWTHDQVAAWLATTWLGWSPAM